MIESEPKSKNTFFYYPQSKFIGLPWVALLIYFNKPVDNSMTVGYIGPRYIEHRIYKL